jgi:hypothetical protein
MELTTTSFEDGGVIPDRHGFARPVSPGPVELSENVNPHLAWDDVPDGTRSFALVCHDPDVPSRGDDVNQPDREVPADLHRVDFYHWGVVDLPPDLREIDEGEFASGPVAGGQQVAAGPYGCRQAMNDFTGWFSGDPDMAGRYYGYDGPAPPWNDSIPHRYIFTIYALDIANLDLGEDFTGQDVMDAMGGHILDEASVFGTYTQNPRHR